MKSAAARRSPSSVPCWKCLSAALCPTSCSNTACPPSSPPEAPSPYSPEEPGWKSNAPKEYFAKRHTDTFGHFYSQSNSNPKHVKTYISSLSQTTTHILSKVNRLCGLKYFSWKKSMHCAADETRSCSTTQQNQNQLLFNISHWWSDAEKETWSVCWSLKL